MSSSDNKHTLANTAVKRNAARLAVASDLTLLVLKSLVALITGSVGVLAEVVNSAGDLVGAMIVYMAVRIAEEPPDATHEYGHGKIENLSGIAIAALVIGGGVYAGLEAVQHLVHPVHLPHPGIGALVMAISAGVNQVVSGYLLKVGKATESPALVADGAHLRTDVLTSTVVLLGLSLVAAGAPAYCDSVAGLVVSCVIVGIGLSLARSAIDSLSDRALPDDEEQTLRDVLAANPAVISYHRLRTRRAGSERHADVHVQVDDRMTFVDAHRLAEQIEDELRAALPSLDPVIHIEPHDEEMRHQREKHEGLPSEPARGVTNAPE